ncbi:hypothetical protein [Roseivirga pacifica]|uniref:hypothetical protein n=1 Tax=Roseivirga pacifica TaxID=1267423 RepID=UPI003BAAB334
MKGSIIILMACMALLAPSGYAQQTSVDQGNGYIQSLNQFLLHKNVENNSSLTSIEELITRLEKVRSRRSSDLAFLKAVFYKTHQRLLVKYDRLACMDETLASGKYGCLTGTALYSIILEHFGFEHQIMELPNHVYLQVMVGEKVVIFESTQPKEGFITEGYEVTERIEQYLTDARKSVLHRTIGDGLEDGEKLQTSLSKPIGNQQLAALQYFNESVKNYNNSSFGEAADYAMSAYELYPNRKNEMLMQLVINKIMNQKKLKDELKNTYLNKYIQFIQKTKLSQTK